jgi:ATP synthase F1 delta subunit
MKEIDVKKLFDLALDEVVNLEEGLYAFAGLVRGNYELRQLFENPLVPPADKKQAFARLFPEALPLFRDLVQLLIDENLAKSLIGLSEKLTRMVAARLKLTFVDLSSPYPLSDEQRQQVEKLIGSRAYVRVTIDPSLIGGIKFLTSDGRAYDGSLKGKLERMKEKLAYAA